MRIFRTLRGAERGQILPIMALLAVAFIGLLGLAIDGGRLYVAKAELSRALDSAALAGVVELPDQNEAESTASAYLAEHLPDASVSFPAPIEGSEFRVGGTRTIGTVFMSVFGFDDVEIDGVAGAGFGAIAVDAVLGIDSTGSMGWPCNSSQSNSGCPIKEAKDAATDFTQILLAGNSPDTQVGVVPYRDCYTPPFTGSSASRCVDEGVVVPLTTDEFALTSTIDDIEARGWTNVCFGLYRSGQILFGPNSSSDSNALRIIVFLSDGDNNYNRASYSNSLDQPPSACRPSNPGSSDPYVNSSGCNPSQSNERDLDEQMWDVAESLKAQGAVIYVVGLGVCGSSSVSLCNTGMIGGGSHDNSADRNLLKCIASSSGGTNDRYFEVDSASDLPEVFQRIAQVISFRLVE